jgi:hypothetical protein
VGRMRTIQLASLAASMLSVGAANAQQSEASKSVCQYISPNDSLPYGHPGHALIANQYSCTVVAGPHSGAVVSGNTYLEARGASAYLLSANGLIRGPAPGSFSVFQHLAGELTFLMTDGKPTGWTMKGSSRMQAGAGAMKALDGRTMDWTAMATGPETFTIDWTFR